MTVTGRQSSQSNDKPGQGAHAVSDDLHRGTPMRNSWLAATLAAIALVCVRPAAAQIGIVSVTGGRLEGVTADGVTSFKGVPFAAPPVGSLRWRAPQAVVPWHGIKQADHFGPSCMQNPSMLKLFDAPPAMSEDCLYLNVWTPAKSTRERLPVMVWIYGGAFEYGSASSPIYDGTRLAKKGVVLVSIAYRTGVFGFLADLELSAESPHHVSGNYGLRDMIVALKWVRANISRFGGDPRNVTIFGESAGGAAISILAVSPAARGLFQRAISESGGSALAPVKLAGTSYTISTLPFRPLASAEATGQRFLARLGAQDLAAARALPAGVIQRLSDSAAFGGGAIWPIFDGDVLPNDAYDLYEAGRFNDTPVLVGTNANEGGLGIFGDFSGTTPAKFEARVRAAYGKYAQAILAVYPHATNTQAEQAAKDLFVRDAGFACETWTWARLQSERGHGKTYLYYFDQHSPFLPLGPVHGQDLYYEFGNLTAPPPTGHAPEPADRALSSAMQSYWVNFAKTGNPNGSGLPHWPAFTVSSQRVMRLDTYPHAGPVPNLRQLKVLDAYFAWLRKEAKQKRAN